MTPQSSEGVVGDARGGPPAGEGGDEGLIDVEALLAEHPVRSQPLRAPARVEVPRRRRRWPWWTALVVVAAGAWALLAYLSATALRDDLTAARQDLVEGRQALLDGDLETADARFAAAREVLSAAPDRTRSVVIAPARLVPTVDRTLDSVAELAAATGRVADALGAITSALTAQPGGLGALTPRDGRLPIDVVAELTPLFTEAAAELERAEEVAAGLPVRGVDAAVVAAREELLELVRPAAAQARTASLLAERLPVMFGALEPRHYLVAASNPTETRGTGGFLGAFTVMTVDGGEMTFGPVTPVQDLVNVPAGELPWPDPSLEQRYDAYGGSGNWMNINLTPDFPSAARLIEQLYEATTGLAVDGVLTVDPFAFEELIALTGPVDLPGHGTVGADEVVRFVTHDAYAEITDPDERKRLIGEVALAALQGLVAEADAVPPRALLEAFGRMFARGAVRIHATDPEVQALLVELGVDGALDVDTPDVLAVFANSGTASKIDFYLSRTIHYDVVLGDDRSAAATLTVEMVNDAPTSGEVAYVIGPNSPLLEAGDNLQLVSAYCAPGCAINDAPDEGYADLPTDVGTELGFGVASTWQLIPSGQARQLIWTWTVPDAWTGEGTDGVYRLTYLHQPMLNADRVVVEVTLPAGAELREDATDLRAEGDRVVVTLDGTTDAIIEIPFSAPDG